MFTTYDLSSLEFIFIINLTLLLHTTENKTKLLQKHQ